LLTAVSVSLATSVKQS
ncbi:nitronate monooxygenase family protein, partial [Vibrio parahaemolyticus V-223/04]